ncbi:MAG TPA: methyltransferase domain-containing protein [Usitatibacteraceae bacterium]|nr:methyltransferase domain-containing protein [Usitatibacteraceae bacterium]
MAGPTREFWQQRFRDEDTPWDRGGVNPQLEVWLAGGAMQPGRILVPGCGSGHEVVALAARGFAVTALDFAPEAVQRTRERLAAAGQSADVVEADALSWQPDRPFDAVYEQTCLCALYPDHWIAYAAQLERWLTPGGMLFALFMQVLRPASAEGMIEGPPYHCDINAMRALFASPRWDWPKPPYDRSPHPRGIHELAVRLQKRTDPPRP